MIEAITDRPIRLEQLAEELSVTELVLHVEDGVSTVTCWNDDVSYENLQIALNNHVPHVTAPPTVEDRIQAAQELIDSLQSQINSLQEEIQPAEG